MGEIKYGIAWSDKYELGNEQVDLQHHRLFELVSELVGSCMDGSNTVKLKNTIDHLVDYTVRHFYDEESLQVQYNYPEYRKHKQIHEDFKVTVGNLVQKFNETGSSSELSNDVNKIIVNWLVEHIISEDKKIGDHIRKIKS